MKYKVNIEFKTKCEEKERIKIRKIEFSLSIDSGSCIISEVIEFPDYATDEDIQRAHVEWQLEKLDGGWDEVD